MTKPHMLNPEFHHWFSSSVVKDANGDPQVVYGEDHTEADVGLPSFSAHPEVGGAAVEYSHRKVSRLREVFLAIQKPLELGNDDGTITPQGLAALARTLSIPDDAADVIARELNWKDNGDFLREQVACLDDVPEGAYAEAYEVIDNPLFIGFVERSDFDGIRYSYLFPEGVDEPGPGYDPVLETALAYRPLRLHQIRDAKTLQYAFPSEPPAPVEVQLVIFHPKEGFWKSDFGWVFGPDEADKILPAEAKKYALPESDGVESCLIPVSHAAHLALETMAAGLAERIVAWEDGNDIAGFCATQTGLRVTYDGDSMWTVDGSIMDASELEKALTDEFSNMDTKSFARLYNGQQEDFVAIPDEDGNLYHIKVDPLFPLPASTPEAAPGPALA